MRIVPAACAFLLLAAACALAFRGFGPPAAPRPLIVEGAGPPEAGADGVRPLRILFVGNSYTHANGLPSMVRNIAGSAGGRPVETGMVAMDSASLGELWAMERPRAALASGRWDIAVFQEHSAWTVSPDRAAASALSFRLWAAEARSRGARPAVYGTWPERPGSPLYAGGPGSPMRGYASMLAAIRTGAPPAARAAGAELVPVGDLWDAALRRDPGVVLWHPDGHHPSVAGTYLAALGLARALAGTDPSKVAWRPDGMDGRLAEILRGVAAGGIPPGP